ncbi:MAG: aminodeoxychorismate synthase component I [Sarcina sp.]
MEFIINEIETKYRADELYEIWKDEKDTILLDSSKEDSIYSNYSFIGINEFLKIKSKGDLVHINDEKPIKADVFKLLNNFMKEFKLEKSLEKEIPFIAGAIGYISYDMGRNLEKIEELSKSDYEVFDSYFLFFNNLIIFDLKKNKVYISAFYKNKIEAINSIEIIKSKIENFSKASDIIELKSEKEVIFNSNFTRESYIDAVAKMKDYILEGHIYIANMTQRFFCDCHKNGYKVYKNLREINKAPFSAYLNLEHMEVLSSSPERFLKINNNKVETRPIKGTRPRGKTKEEDEKNKLELLNSEKDKSELLMIVDLERNDLSKVCKPGSIKVTELFKLESYSTVFHLVSTIIGELEEENTAIDCIRECFPGGSITGTPKIRAMEVIEELEALKRGLYTGAIGYFDFRGNSDFNIVIRTIVKKDNKAYFGVGGGITIESIEEMEYEETLDKAKALIEVLR